MSLLINPYCFASTAATDPNFSSVVALLHFDGSDSSTTFTDSSGYARTFTPTGNAHITTAQSKHGTASGYFDGNGDYITAPSSTDFNFGTGDFTVETFIRFNTFPAVSGSIVGSYPGTWVLQYRPDQGNKIVWYDGGSTASAALSLSTGTWYHFAVCRSGTSLRIFLDGVQTGSTATNTTNVNGTGALTIATLAGAGQSIDAWLDELRITKGVARYTSDFTPPTSAFPNS